MEPKDIKIIDATSTIELSKRFAKAAQYFGSPEFNTLQNVRNMFPNYSVTTKTIKKAHGKDSYKDLTYTYMENYIKSHDDENGTILAEFMDMRATSKKAEDVKAKTKPYGAIKKWFLDTYPEIKGFREHQAELTKKAA